MCLPKEGVITLQRGILTAYIFLVEAVWLRWNVLESEKFVPSSNITENNRRCFWRHSGVRTATCKLVS